MGAVSDSSVLNLFKTVYGDLVDVVPKDQELSKAIPFSQKQKVGQNYIEAIALTMESGITFTSSANAVELNSPRAGTVAQASVVPFVSVLPSVLPFQSISRSAGGGVQSFYDATKWIVRNNLKSHEKFQEIIRLYGQSPGLLGYVSYFSGFYRDASFEFGTGTLNGITFTNGVNTTTKNILFQQGTFASGIWIGMESVEILQVDSAGIILASGSLVSVNSQYGYITVDFVPVPASSETSTRMCFRGMQDGGVYPGVNAILSTQGSLFGINNQRYSLWQGARADFAGTLFTLSKFNTAVANMVNAGGDCGDLVVYLNPRSWATITTDEAGLRLYDSSYKAKMAENGFESITFYAQNGVCTFKPHRCVKEGEAYALSLHNWSRSGSQEVSFTLVGMQQPIIFPLPTQLGYAFRSYSDQYLFCHAPAQSLYISGINDESAS